MIMLDDASFERGLQEGERLAREGSGQDGVPGIACRFSFHLHRSFQVAIRQEVERGSAPLKILRGMEPAIANAAATILVNTNLDIDATRQQMTVFAKNLIAEVMARIELSRADMDDPSLVAEIATVDGGSA